MIGRYAGRVTARADRQLAILAVLGLATVGGFASGGLSRPAQVLAFWVLMGVVHATFLCTARRLARLVVSGPEPPDPVARGARRLWRLGTVAGAALLAGDVWQVADAVVRPDAPTGPTGGPVQMAALVVAIGAMVAGLLLHPLATTGANARHRYRLDVATVMAAAVTFGLWVAEVPAGGSGAGRALLVAGSLLVQPGMFLVVIFAVVKLLLGGRPPFTPATGAVLGAAAVLQSVLQAVPVEVYLSPESTPWLLAGNVVASALLAMGARVEEMRVRACPGGVARQPRRPYSLLPYAAMATTWVLALGVLAARGLDLRAWLILTGVAVTTLLVIGRQLAAFRHIAELLRERDAMAARLTEMAYHDGLTGLPNRSAFLDRLAERLAAGPVTVFLVDLDGFKPVNDRYGHATGDRLLVEVGRRLRSCVRSGETVARLGGDEFAVLVDGPAGDLGRRLAAALHDQVRLGAVEVPLRASVGAATGGPDTHDPDSLLHAADMAMYDRKRGAAVSASAPGA
jgi:diguanylate cyclase (GGDEF)-like protein